VFSAPPAEFPVACGTDLKLLYFINWERISGNRLKARRVEVFLWLVPVSAGVYWQHEEGKFVCRRSNL
jgi:hypothetical protein